ncbi:PfkB family carbohydrate kinase [Rathayibacter sp. KR2-224]|uniref:PfkB family carbohydrate kinase n=1 Tax=Rathayibacter sp. KR2-224 TaxID=3400913 RepID=UPI003C0F304F
MRITVVGDTLLDVDVRGTAERLLADAPAPVVDVQTIVRRAGGAGLVACMLLADGHDVDLVTTLSDDDAAGYVRGCLAGANIVASPSGIPTPVKTRLFAGTRPLARMDEGCGDAPPALVTPEMIETIEDAEVIVVADYGRGLADDADLRRAIARRSIDIPVVWDPHPRGGRPVAGVTVATPNLTEAIRAAGMQGKDAAAAAGSARVLRGEWACPVAVTLGEMGVLLADALDAPPSIHQVSRVTAVDPCGAGDRFSSALAVALASGAALPDAVATAADIAALFLARGGVSALGTQRAPRFSGPGSAAPEAVSTARERHGVIVAMACDSDTLTPEDVRRFLAARALGDSLVLVIDCIEGTPSAVENQRIEALERALLALECVDEVVLAPRAEFESLLRSLRPHVWVESADPRDGGRLDPGLAASWGGQLVTLAYGERHVVEPRPRREANLRAVPSLASAVRAMPEGRHASPAAQISAVPRAGRAAAGDRTGPRRTGHEVTSTKFTPAELTPTELAPTEFASRERNESR